MAVQHLRDEVGRVLGGRYRLIAPVGAGASARVFVADDVTLRRRVAVKILHEALAADEAFLRRFRAEAQAAASLNHPHVLGVFDWGHDEVPYLVTEFLAGGSLHSILDSGRLLSPSQALMVGLEAARGLEYAHGQGLVHRDIKPANLLFDADGRLRIADFGLARALAEAGLTDPSGEMVGTARYTAPEQARGSRVGLKADVYSLALVINESVTGTVPFVADTVVGTLMARVDAPLDPGPELGPLQGPVRRAGQVEPDDRVDAGELAASLMAAAVGLTRPEPLPLVGAIDPTVVPEDASELTQIGLPGPPAVAPARDDETPRRRWPWLVVAVLLAAGAAAAGVFAWVSNQPESNLVPELAGLTDLEGAAKVAEFGWDLDLVDVREPETVTGEIIRTEPEAGAELADGEVLRVYVSLGEPRVPIPDVEGRTVEEATAVLESVDLGISGVREVAHEEVAAGVVIGLDLPAGTSELDPGSTVELIASSGPVDRSVPQIPADSALETARAEITAERLTFTEQTEFSDEVPEGDVIRYRPSSGAVVPADSEVTILVSLGPEPREIPNVIALGVAEASAELEELGFVVTGVLGNPSLPVIATDPPAGELHLPGTEIVIATELNPP